MFCCGLCPTHAGRRRPPPADRDEAQCSRLKGSLSPLFTRFFLIVEPVDVRVSLSVIFPKLNLKATGSSENFVPADRELIITLFHLSDSTDKSGELPL